VHHAQKSTSASANDAQFKAEQEKRRKEEAISNATGLRVLAAIGAAVPVRLMKRVAGMQRPLLIAVNDDAVTRSS
jgi:ParB family chromosome partitioning protein